MHILFRKMLTYMALVLLAINFSACAASLPDVKTIKAELSEERGVPEVKGTEGKLSPGQSKKLLKKVEGEAPKTERLERRNKAHSRR